MYVIKLILKIKYRISFLGFREIIVRLVREKRTANCVHGRIKLRSIYGALEAFIFLKSAV